MGMETPKLLTQVPKLENIVIIEPYKAVDKDGKLWIWKDIPSFGKQTTGKSIFHPCRQNQY